MICSRLELHHRCLVVDASVILNVFGTGKPIEILTALNRKIIVENITLKEVKRDPFSQQPAMKIISNLEAKGLLKRTQLSDTGYKEFLDIVGAPSPNNLDDGEAAALACANEIENAVAVIDEKKGIQIAKSRYPSMTVISSLDLFSNPVMRNEFPAATLEDLVYNALTKARMRVPTEFRTWAIELIGKERALNCPSLSSFLTKDFQEVKLSN